MIAFARYSYRILALWILVLPLLATAQSGLPTQIVPCSGAVAQGGLQPCNICHLAELAQNIINTGIYLTIFISAVLFAYAGWLYVTQLTIQKQQKATSIFRNVVLGLIIILTAWIVVDTLMKELLDAGRFGPWNSLQCDLFRA